MLSRLIILLLHSVQDTFRSQTATEGYLLANGTEVEQLHIYSPVLVGAMSVTSGMMYTLKVEILQTSFTAGYNKHVRISIDDNDYGTCEPTCEYCCTWYTCTLTTAEIIPGGSTAAINVQYVGTRMYPGLCDNQEEVRITLNLKG